MKQHSIFAWGLVLALALTGCGTASGSNVSQAGATSQAQGSAPEAARSTQEVAEAGDNTQEDSGLSGAIRVAGSTSVGPLMLTLKEEFESRNSGVSVEVQQTGSSAGIEAAGNGTADIGMSSRELKDEEKESLADITIALDGIAVVVNPANGVEGLTMEQIGGIFQGEITNWNQVGGADAEIIVVSREEGSGTRGAFEELVGLEEVLAESALFESSTGGVKSNIASSPDAIGYLSLGSMDDTVKALAVDEVACSVETVRDATYKIARPFILCVPASGADAASQALIDFILSEEGQAIVEGENYIGV